jgi:hypothetical protein
LAVSSAGLYLAGLSRLPENSHFRRCVVPVFSGNGQVGNRTRATCVRYTKFAAFCHQFLQPEIRCHESSRRTPKVPRHLAVRYFMRNPPITPVRKEAARIELTILAWYTPGVTVALVVGGDADGGL